MKLMRNILGIVAFHLRQSASGAKLNALVADIDPKIVGLKFVTLNYIKQNLVESKVYVMAKAKKISANCSVLDHGKIRIHSQIE